jgi:hypothetical protein
VFAEIPWRQLPNSALATGSYKLALKGARRARWREGFQGENCAVNKHLSEYLGDRCSWEGERCPLSLAEQEPFAQMFTRRLQGDVIFNSPPCRAEAVDARTSI